MAKYKIRQYVKVDAEPDAFGVLVPRSFVWRNGQVYQIDQIFSYERAACFEAGGFGTRYHVRASCDEIGAYNRIGYIWWEKPTGKWFIPTNSQTETRQLAQ